VKRIGTCALYILCYLTGLCGTASRSNFSLRRLALKGGTYPIFVKMVLVLYWIYKRSSLKKQKQRKGSSTMLCYRIFYFKGSFSHIIFLVVHLLCPLHFVVFLLAIRYLEHRYWLLSKIKNNVADICYLTSNICYFRLLWSISVKLTINRGTETSLWSFFCYIFFRT
jgi:high-affinity Fe2+/Pb2+ permease